uniref:Uncharacterized protein n=1 Tax=Candidozyma auris TaxID=498019 RepID=A0A0L0NSD0_CANAR
MWRTRHKTLVQARRIPKRIVEQKAIRTITSCMYHKAAFLVVRMLARSDSGWITSKGTAYHVELLIISAKVSVEAFRGLAHAL